MWSSFYIDDQYLADTTEGQINYQVYIGTEGSQGLPERDFIAESNHITESVSGRHGSYFYGATFVPRKISIPCFINGISANNLRKLENILTITTPKKLRRDDYKPYAYIWVVSDGAVKLKELVQNGLIHGFFTLNLIAYDCFYYSVHNSLDPYNYDDPTIYYDSGLLYAEDMPPSSISNITSGFSFQLYNAGNYYSKMVITITGDLANLTITNTTTSQSFTLSSIEEQTLVIDGNKGQITIGSNLATHLFDGDFIELASGLNNLTLSGTGLNISTLSFSYKNTYV